MVSDGKLIYKPQNLEVIRKDDSASVCDAIADAYVSDEGLDKGQGILFQYLESKWLGIRRATVIKFSKSQTNYQINTAEGSHCLARHRHESTF